LFKPLHLFVFDLFGRQSNDWTLGSLSRGAAEPGAPPYYIMLPTRTRSMERPQKVLEQSTSESDSVILPDFAVPDMKEERIR
jgi:hypothetical protein